MPHQFKNIPNWNSQANQGAGLEIADLTRTGKQDLIVFQINSLMAENQGLYRIGRNVNAAGDILDGWTNWLTVPDWNSWENQGGDLAIADLTGTGRQDLVVFQIDNPPQLNRGRYKIGRNLDVNGVLADGWTNWVEIPDWESWENQGGAIAIGDLTGTGRQDLIVFQIDSPPQINRGRYKIGRNLGVDGVIAGGWTNWIEVPGWFSWENAGAGVAIADLDNNGKKDLIVFHVDDGITQNQGFFRIGRQLDLNGLVQGGWLPWYGIPNWTYWENQGAGIAVGNLTSPSASDLIVVAIDNVPDQAENAGVYQVLPLDHDPKIQGSWELLAYKSAVLPVHAALLPTGKVLFAAGGTQSYDVDAAGNPNGRRFTGRVETMAFDATTEQWTRQVNMADGRWYPTLVTLGDGGVLIAAGLDRNGDPNRSLEVLTPDLGTGTIKTLPLPAPAIFSRLPSYPHLFQMQDGTIFFTGGRMDDEENELQPCLLNITQSPIGVTPLGGLKFAISRNQSTSVLLPPAQAQQVMIMGGATPNGEDNATDSTNIIDLSNPATAQYRAAPPLLLPRVHLNAVILPDRTIFVCGGALQREGGAAGDRKITARFQSEIYDPQANTWQLAATARVERMYHSVALLLPDGKVISASGNPDKGRVRDWSPDDNEELRLEVYIPPYLFGGARPAIGTVAREWRYGQTIAIESPQAGTILWASLIRNGVVTHSFNTSQRLVDLPISSQAGGTLQVTVTNNPNLAPPGWYMLFLTGTNRIPSVATWIHLA